MKVLIVGESNPYGDNDTHALLPWPANATGDRLRKIFGLTALEYLRTFDRVNLMRSGARWSPSVARGRAWQLSHKQRVLLGARVAAAHDVPFKPFRRFMGIGFVDVLVLPHPSGRCRIWNDRRLVSKVRRAMRKFLDS